MKRFVNQKILKNKTELFIQRVKAFEDKKLRNNVWNKMDNDTQNIINKIIKKGLTLIAKKS